MDRLCMELGLLNREEQGVLNAGVQKFKPLKQTICHAYINLYQLLNPLSKFKLQPLTSIAMQKKSIIQELERKLEQSENDKMQLQKSIQELNECYQTKIQIMENTIEAYESRIEELLQWKKSEIDKQLGSTAKYEQQNKKLLAIIDQLEQTFQEEKARLERENQEKSLTIKQISEQRELLLSKTQQSEQKIDQLVREHTKEIQNLKHQLILLKQEFVEPSNEAKVVELNRESQETQHRAKNQQFGSEQANVLREVQGQKKPLQQISIGKKNQIVADGKQKKNKNLVYRSPLGQIPLV